MAFDVDLPRHISICGARTALLVRPFFCATKISLNVCFLGNRSYKKRFTLVLLLKTLASKVLIFVSTFCAKQIVRSNHIRAIWPKFL